MKISKKVKMYIFFLIALLTTQNSWAGARDQALKLHNRLTGVPPSDSVLLQMTNLITAGQAEQAALLALENPYFYNLKGKSWVKTWTNASRSNRVPLNDYVATVLGAIRDNTPFNKVLTDDILYIGGSGHGQTVRDYAKNNNDHYADLEDKSVDLKQFLELKGQASMNTLGQTAGIITTRASGEAFFSAGTNRRMTRFLFINFLCKDFENLHDITIPDIYVRRDVERNPGGDSRTYRNKCVGCHAGQDSLGGAWSYFDYRDGQVVYDSSKVQDKINKNNNFSSGSIVSNDSWTNLWVTGQNAVLDWGPTQSGNGAKSFGQMVTETGAFGECMAQRSFEMACTRSPLSDDEKDRLKMLGDEFMTTENYNLKRLIAKVAISCMGE